MTSLARLAQLLTAHGLDGKRLEHTPGRGVLLHTEGLDIALSPRSEGLPHYCHTDRFNLAYLASRDLTPAERDRMASVQQAVEGLERDHPGDVAGLEQLAACPAGSPDPAPASQSPRIEAPDSLIRITAACNQTCLFCNNNESAPDAAATPAAVHERLELLSGVGQERPNLVSFTGGEPTLDPNLLDYVRSASGMGLTVGLQTNAVMLGEEQLATRLWEAGVRHLLVSLHAAQPIVSDRLTATKGDWERTLAGIHAAVEAGFEVGTNTVVCTENLDQLEPLVDCVHREFGGRVRTMVFSLMAPVARATQHLDRLPSISDALVHLSPAVEDAVGRGLLPVIPGVCGAPPCTLGSIARFSDDLRRPAPAEPAPDRCYLPACQGCAQRTTCSGIWRRYLERHGGEEFIPLATPISPYCP